MDIILKFILENIAIFLKNIINFISYPLLKIIETNIPNFTNYFTLVNEFLSTYVFKGIQFSKMVFLNLTNINHDVFNLAVLSFFIIISLSIVIVTFKLVYNVWQIYTGNKKGDS